MFLICLVIFYLLAKLPRIFVALLNSLLHIVNFSYCEFQDLCSGKKIGSAREVDGLYYFEEDVSLCGEAQAANNEVTFSIEDEIMLWHLRLGHPSFSYLQHLFPLLFKNKNPSLFQCEICVLSKHHRASFPSQPYKKSAPFSLIHSDI